MKENTVQFPNTALKKVRIGEWVNTIGPDVIVPDEKGGVVDFLHGVFERYRKMFEPTPGLEHFFYRETGFPSPIIRVDMPFAGVVNPLRQFVYEVETRPAGLGSTSVLFPELTGVFKEVLDQVSDRFGQDVAVKAFRYSQNPRHDPNEEKRELSKQLDVPFFGPDQAPDNLDRFLFLGYGNVGDPTTLERFESRGLFPIRDDGNKDYLVRMGLAKEASAVDIARRLRDNAPFVLKPRQGMWGQDVKIFAGEGSPLSTYGAVSPQSVVKVIEEGRITDFLVQPFVHPGTINLDGNELFALARIYATADLDLNRYIVQRGYYLARPHLKLHGTNDAITGQILFE